MDASLPSQTVKALLLENLGLPNNSINNLEFLSSKEYELFLKLYNVLPCTHREQKREQEKKALGERKLKCFRGFK